MLDRYFEEDRSGWGFVNAGTRILWHDQKSYAAFTHNATVTKAALDFLEHRGSLLN